MMPAKEFLKLSNEELIKYINSISDFSKRYRNLWNYPSYEFSGFCDLLGICGLQLHPARRKVRKPVPELCMNFSSFSISYYHRSIYVVCFENHIEISFDP